MRTKNGSVRELIAGIQQAAEQEEYGISRYQYAL